MNWHQRLLRTGIIVSALTLGTLSVSHSSPNIVPARFHSSFHATWSASSHGSSGISRGGSSFGSSGISRGGSSFGRSYGSGITRRTAPTGMMGGSGITRPGSATVARAPLMPRSAADTAIARGHSAQSFAAYQTEQSRYRAPPVMAPRSTAAARQSTVWRQYGNRWSSPGSFYAARSAAITRLPPGRAIYWTSPPAYVLIHPSYGNFSSAFLGSLLGNAAGNALWAYSHRNDQAYIQWHAEMMVQAQQNAELQAQLGALDAQIGQMQAQNVTADPNALPQDIDPSMVVASSTMMAATTDDGMSTTQILMIVMAITLALVVGLFVFFRPRSPVMG